MSPLLVEDTYDVQEKMTYIPKDYQKVTFMKIKTDSETDPLQVYSEIRESLPIFMWRLPAKGKTLYSAKPILVRVYRDGDLFFAENETLDVYGTGDTPQNAIHDLVVHIVHFFKYYKDIDENKLMGNALKLKALYQNLLAERQYAD